MPTIYPEGLIIGQDQVFSGEGPSQSFVVEDLRTLIKTLRMYAGLGLSCEQLQTLFLDTAFSSGTIYAMPGSTWVIDDLTFSFNEGREDGPFVIPANCTTAITPAQTVKVGTLTGVSTAGVVGGYTGSIILNWPDDVEYIDDATPLPAPGWNARIIPDNIVFGQTVNLKGTFRTIASVSPDFLAFIIPACASGPGPDPDPDPQDNLALIENLIGIKLANLNPPRFPFDRYPSNLK